MATMAAAAASAFCCIRSSNGNGHWVTRVLRCFRCKSLSFIFYFVRLLDTFQRGPGFFEFIALRSRICECALRQGATFAFVLLLLIPARHHNRAAAKRLID
ncbi:uncharacterized protein LOC112343018 [Selaginella moellendorffii]|uniref:uncharacterized protein LOC112343018 n=1 Tax=Selaginella moellendorffii TaxID=88036 RepID=UPI000D1C7D7D|nr:uncharacterized protein LOC112343018 [Selaginella moellendorffii]|eukprot:XP_024521569.1 uncharacterized protein LOC112343018 [Selaginella moellendorffii]